MCFCQLAGGFDTHVVLQDDGHLIDGGMRVERSEKQDIFNTHEFNGHGIGMCKEFRRRALANCVRSTDSGTGFVATSTSQDRLSRCMSYFDHLAGLVKYNSNATPKSFTPVFTQHWSKSVIDDMISREIEMLGLHLVCSDCRTCFSFSFPVSPLCIARYTESTPDFAGAGAII